MVRRLPDIAIKECRQELRAACRLPIDERALVEVESWLRPNFERILGHPEGAKRWSDHGQRMRDNARFIGTFADFFASHTESTSVGIAELKRAYEVIRADCTVRSERTPLAWEYCNPPEPGEEQPAEQFLRAIAPQPETV
jgi:hypothetical protein